MGAGYTEIYTENTQRYTEIFSWIWTKTC